MVHTGLLQGLLCIFCGERSNHNLGMISTSQLSSDPHDLLVLFCFIIMLILVHQDDPN